MAESIARGESLQLSEFGDLEEIVLNVVDGTTGYISSQESVDPRSSEKVLPGDRITYRPAADRVKHIHARSTDLEVEVVHNGYPAKGEEGYGENRDFVSVDRSARASVMQSIALLTNVTPGADTNVQSGGEDLDLEFPRTGTMFATFLIESTDADAVAIVEATYNGTAVTGELNDGVALNAGEFYTFPFPVLPDNRATYNIQLDTAAVELDLLQIDFAPRAELT